jgi:hypothetical protein
LPSVFSHHSFLPRKFLKTRDLPLSCRESALVLTGHVEFKAVLQRGNRIQVPRLVRWSYKMKASQVLKVSVHFEGDWSSREEFFAQISKDGRICVPKLTCGLLKAAYEEESIIGAIVVVLLRPFDADETEDEDED